MKVYAIEVQFENYEHYEDYDKWNYIYKVFDSREKALNYLSDMNKVVREVVKQDANCVYYLALSPGQPIQLKLQPLSFNNAFDICAQEKIIADDGNTILGYKERDWEDVDDWEKLYVSFDIQEWEVE
jgi:hypothetical protein